MLVADTAFAQLSVAQGDSIAFARYVVPEGAQLGSPIAWGSVAVAAAFAGWEPVETLAWTPRFAQSTSSGDLGWSVATRSTLRNADGSVAHSLPWADPGSRIVQQSTPTCRVLSDPVNAFAVTWANVCPSATV